MKIGRRKFKVSRIIACAAAVGLAAAVFVGVPGTRTESQARAAGSPCGVSVNPVACENQQPGTPPSQWDIQGAGDDDIQGFSTDVSVNVGSPIAFKVNTSASAYTIDIYRLGYYQGNGARKIDTVAPSAALPQNQPTCLSDPSTLLVDCGNWAVSATWNVPSTAVSGVYLAKLTRPDNGDSSQITFVVRNDASTSDVIYQTSDPTWQAYNVWGGNDFYVGTQALTNSQARAFKVSYNRPYATRGRSNGRDFLFANEYPTLRFMERNGYDVSYIAGVDTDRRGDLLTQHKVFMSVGHDEYWSQAQRTNVEKARDAGVNLMFLSGNEVYWRTRYEPSIDGSNTAYRTLVTYKETWDNAPTDPVAPHSTATFRDPRFATGDDGGRPENALTGTIYMSNDTDLAIQVSGAEGRTRLWRGTSLGTVAPTAVTTLAPHTVGYESDEDLDNGFRPAGLIDLSTTTGSAPAYLQDFGSVTKAGTTTHHVTLYRAASGALVFGAGTIQWGWGLDEVHDGVNPAPADSRMQQATVNILADMSALPSTLMSGLASAQPSTDTTPPVVTVTSPAAGSALPDGAQVTVAGTATDSGGVVAGVEVTTDAGVTWHPATGTANWTYTGFVRSTVSDAIRVRATDDSARTSAPTAVSTSTACPCSLFGDQTPSAATADSGDGGATELGTRFTTDQSGFVTGVRFYKATANTGTHTGSLWASDGSLLASGTFTGESASGWQTLVFPQAVAVSAGTQYTVSYFAPAGHYSATGSFYFYREFSAAPLHAQPFSPIDSSRVASVFRGGHGFPNSTFKAVPNYWVDPVFTLASAAAPAVSSVAPRHGATGISTGSSVSATFTADVTASSVSLTVTDPAGRSVAGSTAYDGATRTATFMPSGALVAGSTYSARVTAAGTNGVAMNAPTVWTFSTAASDGRCPCTLVPTQTITPTTASVSDSASVELGVRFTADTDGVVLGIQFYKGAQNIGTHIGSLWAADGTRLATTTFSNESTQGWQYAAFSTPVAVTAGTTYTASYRAPNGHYAVTSGALGAGRDAFPLHAPSNGAVYTYGGSAPTTTTSNDYGVDLLFTVPGSVEPSATPTSPADGAMAVSTSTSIAISYQTSVTTGSTTLLVKDSGGAVVAGSVGLDAVHKVVTFTPASPLTTGTYYTVAISGATSLGGVVQSATKTWSFTTASAAPPPTNATGLFASGVVPASADSGDGAAVSVGVRFTAGAAGSITGVRFFKAAANLGTHTVSLWDTTSGTRLATATATTESASGWQTVAFASSVQLTVGVTYVVSYYAPKGHYSATSGYFSSAVTRGPLTAPGGGNGVYLYGRDALPTSSYNNSNYWVDPLFALAQPPAPVVNARTPLPGSSSVATTTSISATFADDIVASSVQATVTSTVGTNAPVGVTVTTSTDSTNRIVTVSPATPLPRGASVSVSIKASGANGGTMSSPDVWSFVTAQPTPAAGVCPCALWDDAAVPATITASDSAAVELGVQFKSDVAGTVSGVRFYKGPRNTGTHTVYLTTVGGTRLASATATSESTSGWQTVTFASPVAISANTVYLVSYFAPAGGYSVTSGQFASTGQDAAPLHVTARGPSRYVYRAAGASTVPTSTSDANYWVSPVFNPSS